MVLFFDKTSKFEFIDSALVRLSGRRTGEYTGIVMGATRDNTQDFIISSDNVESLLGVIYVPNALLLVEGRADVARESAWTVIYNASNVPVPAGVGPRTGGSRLVQ